MGRRKLTAGHDSSLPLICSICGDVAHGHNFSIASCISCKSFFRRHGLLKPKNYECRFNGNCLITKATRADCLYCRLTKCLEVGMDPLMIRGPSNLSNKSINDTQLIKKNIQPLSLPRPETLNLLQNDCSRLTSDQWNLLSNIIRSYDEQNTIQHVQNLLNRKSSFPPKLRLKSEEIFSIFSSGFTPLQPLIERSPHFRHLSSTTRRTLVVHNIFMTGTLNGYLINRETNAFYHEILATVAMALCGKEHVMNCIRDNNQLEKNGTLIKIMVFVMLFSSNCSIVMYTGDTDLGTMSSSVELVRVQNVYVTMLWKYMMYLYGHDETVVRFSLLMQRILTMYQRTENTMKTTLYSKFADEIATRTEKVLNIQD